MPFSGCRNRFDRNATFRVELQGEGVADFAELPRSRLFFSTNAGNLRLFAMSSPHLFAFYGIVVTGDCVLLVFRSRPELTEGERHFYWAFFSIGILGAILAFIITFRLAAHEDGTSNNDLFALWTLIAGFVGGTCGFMSSYNRWLGFPDRFGWIRAAVGGVMISGIAAVVSGTLILPYYGTMFAPLQLIIAMIESPVLALIWCGCLVTAHKLVETWRAERDSIFAIR